MTKDEALRLALEALEAHADIGIKADKAITAIKAALEAKDEPEQMAKLGWQVIDCPICGGGARAFPKQEAKDEPDYKALWQQMCERCDELDKKLAQRKPLTDEEILTYRHMLDWTAEWSYINFARAIESAHGIKDNT